MKLKLATFCVILLCCCHSEHTLTDTKELLAGKWIDVGSYKNGKPLYDTLGVELNQDFEGVVNELKYVIRTDSGVFKHIYTADSNRFVGIEPATELSIGEYQFINDSVANLTYYQIDTSHFQTTDSKMFGHTEEVRLIESDSGIVMEVLYPINLRDEYSDPTYHVFVKRLTTDSLILQFGNGGTIYVRFKMP
ncbi:MAG: hypothetical protein ACMVP2_19780 [Imperialibacter sp.]|uniref:hypothetical protein n=1 Tax=Imperialibacter sp. TaxID=2038411 RepID=UPI003A89D908